MSRIVAVLVVVGCTPPDPTERFTEVEVLVVEDEAAASERFLQAVEGASDTLHVALPAGEDTEVADAIVAASERGVQVEVLTDYDLASSPAITRLTDAGLTVQLADAGLGYFEFNLGVDVQWDSEMTVMSHSYVVADSQRLVASNRMGSVRPGTRVVYDIRGQDIIQDLLWEHNQMMGGTDATATNAYDAPSKSILETRWRYPMVSPTGSSSVGLEMWFGPQERLLKRVIDAVYSARSGVWILTDDFSNEGLARALQEKARWGFDVEVVVGPHFGDASSQLSRILEDETPDVPKRQITEDIDVPTVILIDYPDDAEGYRPHTRAMVLTHDLFSAARLYRGDIVLTDQLIDGTLWVLSDTNTPDAPIQALEELFRAHRERAEVLP
jgi:hypothetical protein